MHVRKFYYQRKRTYTLVKVPAGSKYTVAHDVSVGIECIISDSIMIIIIKNGRQCKAERE